MCLCGEKKNYLSILKKPMCLCGEKKNYLSILKKPMCLCVYVVKIEKLSILKKSMW
jgi:hypothetical protein